MRIVVLICALAASRGAAAADAVDLRRGLMVHYPLDKDASDASGKGHHAKSHGATPVAGGRIGGAFAFDGKDDYLAIPVEATQNRLRFTIALWLKTTQREAQPPEAFWQHPTLLGGATNGWGSRDLSLMLGNGCAAYFHGLYAGGKDMSVFTGTQLADDRWHHVALVGEGPRVFLYVDGRIANGDGSAHTGPIMPLGKVTQTASGQSLGTSPLFLGACANAHPSPTPTFHYRGLLDDVRIWDRALGAKEIAALVGQAGQTP